MKEARKNQIAFLFLLDKILREGVHLGPEIPKQIERTARMINISYGEAREFAEIVLHSLFLHVIAKSRLYNPSRRQVSSATDLDEVGKGLRTIGDMIIAPKKNKKAKKGTKTRTKK
jgi:hypothetical protein